MLISEVAVEYPEIEHKYASSKVVGKGRESNSERELKHPMSTTPRRKPTMCLATIT
jgi:hypothetical protein